MIRVIDTVLVSSVGKLRKLPPETYPEVAFAGRSNVGKSSLLNAITGRKGLFKVSKSPGRTRTIVHVKALLDNRAELFLVDLPGFGHAKVPKQMQRAWSELIEGYLSERVTLHLVVLLVDIRRGVETEELELLDFLYKIGVPAILAATKLDRLPKAFRKPALLKLKLDTGLNVIGTSSAKKLGLSELTNVIANACGYF
jgi:GTP-binding protein